jgi:phosphoribosylglycinamide formyltransferase-1
MASGRGSNFRALGEHLRSLIDPPAEVVLCISNNPAPGAFEYAREQGIATRQLTPRMFATDDEYSRALLQLLQEFGVDLIVLAGYMRKLPAAVVEAYTERILNIHPALLPDFGGPGMYGMRVHEAVLASGRTESGATVHLVDAEYDTGRIIAQERIPIPPGTTADELAALVLSVEHRLYPATVAAWAERLARRGISQHS